MEIPTDICECFVTDQKYWSSHHGIIEPGSTMEFNPDCPEHGSQTKEPHADRAKMKAQLLSYFELNDYLDDWAIFGPQSASTTSD